MFLLKFLMKVLLQPVMLVLFMLCAGKDWNRAFIQYPERPYPDCLWLHHLCHCRAAVVFHVDSDCHGSNPDYRDSRCRHNGLFTGVGQYWACNSVAVLKLFCSMSHSVKKHMI